MENIDGQIKWSVKMWNIEEITGYKPKTTFYEDFGIAERFGENAICDTYHNALRQWSKNVEYLTELVMVLNWKIWEHYESNNQALVELYDSLWRDADLYATENLKGDDLNYFFATTD